MTSELKQKFDDLQWDLLEMSRAVKVVDEDIIERGAGAVEIQDKATPLMKLISRRLTELANATDRLWRDADAEISKSE